MLHHLTAYNTTHPRDLRIYMPHIPPIYAHRCKKPPSISYDIDQNLHEMADIQTLVAVRSSHLGHFVKGHKKGWHTSRKFFASLITNGLWVGIADTPGLQVSVASLRRLSATPGGVLTRRFAPRPFASLRVPCPPRWALMTYLLRRHSADVSSYFLRLF